MENKKLNKKLNIGKKEILGIKMSGEDKKHILENILKDSAFVECPQESPYAKSLLGSAFKKKHVVYSIAGLCLMVVFSGSVVSASTESLPGEILYPIKVRVFEPAKGRLIFSEEEKMKYQGTLVNERLIEAEMLAYEGMLDESKEEELNSLLVIHTNNFNKALDQYLQNQKDHVDDDAYEEIVTEFQANVNAHVGVLETILKKEDQKEEKPKEWNIQKTARDNGFKLTDTFKNKENKNIKTKAEKAKEDVRALIDKTNLDVDTAKKEISPKKQIFIDNATKKLDHARQLLKEVDEEDRKGDTKKAYERLIDSKVSAKEAGVFLKAGLKLKGKDI